MSHLPEKLVRAARVAEDGICGAALLLMGALPVAELLLRTVAGTGIPGVSDYVQHLTLWVGFLGAMVAAREKRHLSLSTGMEFLPKAWRARAGVFSAAVSTAVACGLAWASFELMRLEQENPNAIAGWIPRWIGMTVLPAAFAVIAARFVWNAGGWKARALAMLGVPAAVVFGWVLDAHAASLFWPAIAVIVVAGLLGAPIFVILGGCALVLFFADGTSVAAVPVQTYDLVTSPLIPTIPLFTLTGFLLAEGKASERLCRLFRAWFGWLPGGLAVVATLACAFFTTFTGASGVTILALGGLLLPMLVRSGYGEKFSEGLLTSSGSIGLLLPPSLPVILYGVVAHVPIPDLFKAGAIPGLLLVLAVAAFGVREARRAKVPRDAFELREAFAALWAAKWDAALPFVALAGLFGGFCTLIEAAAITLTYALFVQVIVHRDVRPVRDLPRVLSKSVALLGGVIAILGVAMGLTNWLVDAQAPMKAAQWVQQHVHSRLLFLLALNLFLIVVGALMDIYSAILVVVPLILPASEAFGIHPLHLGIIFLANMELGYLMPPVGENLFLASYRFEKPVMAMARAVIPFVLAILVTVLVITYVPSLTLVWSSE